MSSSCRSTPVQVVWFKRDLRVADHRPLAAAARTGDPVLPLYVAEPDLWAGPDHSARHWAFAREGLIALRAALANLGQPLVVRQGRVVDVLEQIHANLGIAGLWSHEETGNSWTYQRDRAVAAWCRDRGICWTERAQHGVVRRLETRDGWARHWDRFMAEPLTEAPAGLRAVEGVSPGTIPDAAALGLAPDPCPGRQTGGRDAGLETLETFLHVRGEPYRTAMSSPVTGFDHCSRLSPHLAWGTLSMREIAQATWARQREVKHLSKDEAGRWRGALKSFSGRLHWHCHFMQKLEDAPKIEWRNLHPAYDGLRPAEPDAARLAAWEKGETGLPFVDACMRSLLATGWMNFRMRAMLMAVSSYHLWLDWRRPGEHLARCFTDYEAGIHWPQVQMQSGTTGINTVRIYNPVKQGYDQDPDGHFIRKWVPELADVPDHALQAPWTWEGADRILGKRYPFPVVDHKDAAREARQKVWSVRKGASYRAGANAIQDKHGSRKSGLPNRGRQASGRRKPARSTGSEQMSLGFETPDER